MSIVLDMLMRFWSSVRKLLSTRQSPADKLPAQFHLNSHPKFGRMIYSSRPQSELEEGSRAPLYKVSDGVYVDQLTYDKIRSEHIPVIEQGSSEAYLSINYYQPEVICACWHPREPTLVYIAANQLNHVICRALDFNGGQLTVGEEMRISTPLNISQIRDVAHHSQLPQVLITCEQMLLIWDYKMGSLVASIVFDDLYVQHGGFYPDRQRAWTLALEEGIGNDWIIWNYVTNEYQFYSLERFGEYGRGAVLHPSGKFIGALWNSHECGYFIHTAEPESDTLHYYSKPGAERPEYEAYSPCFSPDGKYLAFVVNSFLAMHQNFSKICVYEIETAELAIEFYTGLKDFQGYQLQFVNNGKELAFYESESNNLHIFNAITGKKLATLAVPSVVRYFAGHQVYAYYLAVHDSGITVFSNPLDSQRPVAENELTESSLAVAARFIEKNKQYLAKVGDWTIRDSK